MLLDLTEKRCMYGTTLYVRNKKRRNHAVLVLDSGLTEPVAGRHACHDVVGPPDKPTAP